MPYKTIDLAKLTQYCLEHPDNIVSAGIQEDFSFTVDIVWANGHCIPNSRPFISSIWGTPVIYDQTTDEYIECWVLTDSLCSWDSTAIRLLTFR